MTTVKDIPSQRNFYGKQYKFGGAFWYKADADSRSKNLSKDAMGRPFMKTRIVKYDSNEWRLPYTTLGEVVPEARRIGLSRGANVTANIYVVYMRHAYDENKY